MREPNPPGTDLDKLARCEGPIIGRHEQIELSDAALMGYAQDFWTTQKDRDKNLMAQELIRRRHAARGMLS